MLSLCYLPGVIAAVLQLYRGTKYKSEIRTGWTAFQCLHKDELCNCIFFVYVYNLSQRVFVAGVSLFGWIAGCCAGNSWDW